MNVLLINASRSTGSTGRNCTEIQEYINSKTTDKCFIAFSVGDITENTYRIGSIIEKRIHALLSRVSGKQAWFSRIGTHKLLKYIDHIKPDVIHLNNIHANYLCFPMIMHYAAMKKIAVVLTLHDCWFFTGKCNHYTLANCQRWKESCGSCPKLRADNKSWFFDRTREVLDKKREMYSSIQQLGVIGVSNWITQEARSSILSKATVLTCIHNWIDTEIFCPKKRNQELVDKLGINNCKIIIGVASNWGLSKGLTGFNTLAILLGERYKILLIGNLLEQRTLEKNIIHIDKVSSLDEMSNYYNLGDVFVTLSLEESFGKVSAEALACGLPVICVNSTANKELVGPGCGEVVEELNYKTIASKIEAICEKGKESYSKKCRDYALQHFEKNAQIEKHLSLYHLLIKEE